MRSAKEIFLDAIQLPKDKQAVFVATETIGKTELKKEVLALVHAHHEQELTLLDEDNVGTVLTLAEAAELLNNSDFAREKLGRYRQFDFPQLEGKFINELYRIENEIWCGTIGVIYRAFQIHPATCEVAFKVYRRLVSDRQMPKLLTPERRGALQHPNIVLVLDAGRLDRNFPYIVMELVNGDSVDKHCLNHKLTVKNRTRLFIDICQGVLHAHQLALVHGDIRSSKVIVEHVDGKSTPKITDFEVEKTNFDRLSVIQAHDSATALVHLAPEQINGLPRETDGRSDIYSLGILLNELLTGSDPFKSKTIGSKGIRQQLDYFCRTVPHLASVQVQKRNPTKFAGSLGIDTPTLATQLQGNLDWIIAKCLEKSPQHRYQSVQYLIEDLENHLRDNPIQADPRT